MSCVINGSHRVSVVDEQLLISFGFLLFSS